MKSPTARIVAGVLIFLLLCPPAGLTAKERRGYDLVVTRLDGSHALGELLAVRPDSLLLLTGTKDLTVSRSDIKSVRIVRPSKAGLFAGLLAVPGVAFAALMAFSLGDTGREKASGFLWGTLIFGGGGAAAGGLLGSAMGKDTTFNIAGEPADLVAHYWAELPRYSRERRLPVLVVTPEAGPRPAEAARPEQPRPPAAVKPAVAPSSARARGARKRFAIGLGETFVMRGSSQEAAGQGSFSLSGDIPPGDAGPHPFDAGISRAEPRHGFLGPLRLSYEWTKHLSAEVELFTSGRWRNSVSCVMDFTSSADNKVYRNVIYRNADSSFSGFLFGLTWRPLAPTVFRRHVIEAGAAAGPAFAKVAWIADPYNDIAPSTLRKTALSWRVQAAYDFHIVPYLSVGAFVGYRHLRLNHPASALTADLWFGEIANWGNGTLLTTEVALPGFPLRASATFWGLRTGFRF